MISFSTPRINFHPFVSSISPIWECITLVPFSVLAWDGRALNLKARRPAAKTKVSDPRLRTVLDFLISFCHFTSGRWRSPKSEWKMSLVFLYPFPFWGGLVCKLSTSSTESVISRLVSRLFSPILHLFSKYSLNSYYMSGTMLGAEYTGMN